MLDSLFPTEPWTTTEVNVLAVQLDHPTVKKYLRMNAKKLLLDITLSTPSEGESDSSYLRRVAEARGQLAVFEALIGIQQVKPLEDSAS